ncbi:hypothetical protein NMY22_g17737 [Coprinellus aureogranulatus]|nr:hypothetical protein NMY22_g17737 [Coprinellus aureogranulatus]
MDALVHIFYGKNTIRTCRNDVANRPLPSPEIAGTAGAFSSSSAISRWGNNYSFFLTPVFFAFAGTIWIFISVLNFRSDAGVDDELEQAGLSNVEKSRKPSSNYLVLVLRGFLNFGESIWVGAKLIFGNRAFIWLLPSYSIALYLHRFLENSLAPAFANEYWESPPGVKIIVGGS